MVGIVVIAGIVAIVISSKKQEQDGICGWMGIFLYHWLFYQLLSVVCVFYFSFNKDRAMESTNIINLILHMEKVDYFGVNVLCSGVQQCPRHKLVFRLTSSPLPLTNISCPPSLFLHFLCIFFYPLGATTFMFRVWVKKRVWSWGVRQWGHKYI